jgi:hypothetical protein
MEVKGKVRKWGFFGTTAIGFLYPDPKGVPSFISRGAAYPTVYSAPASEGRN